MSRGVIPFEFEFKTQIDCVNSLFIYLNSTFRLFSIELGGACLEERKRRSRREGGVLEGVVLPLPPSGLNSLTWSELLYLAPGYTTLALVYLHTRANDDLVIMDLVTKGKEKEKSISFYSRRFVGYGYGYGYVL